VLKNALTLFAQTMGYEKAVISLIDYETKKINRVASYGIPDSVFETIKVRNSLYPMFDIMFDKRFYFGGTYFVPEEANVLTNQTESVFIFPETAKAWIKKKNRALWKVKDFFLIPFLDEEGTMIGYVSLDSPVNNERPSIEDAQLAKIFADQISRIVEATTVFHQVVEKTKKDLMSGLYNHSYFFDLLQELLKNCDFKHPVSLIMFDIDDFKKYNDTYGHQAGDRVIIRVADILKQIVPTSAHVSRYGGEEFALLLPETGKIAAIELGDKILEKVSNEKMQGMQITLSAGVSTAPEDGFHPSTLVSAADNALYTAKRTGKNRINAS
jgi:diguanylate cyclase (GGDEF)-like protein